MPKDRFLNLSAEKQERIMLAAVNELARVPFDEMSINRIIRDAGIPRGSFYQYFEDKNDLLLYIMKGYHEKMRDNIRHTLMQSNGDIFKVFTNALHLTIEFGTNNGNFGFCRNVFSNMRLNEENNFELVRINIADLLEEFMPIICLDNFKYTHKDDLLRICEIVSVLLRRTITQVFADIENIEQHKLNFESEITMLKHGILHKEGGCNV